MSGMLAMVVATAALAYAALLAARRLRGPGDSLLEHALTVGLLFLVGVLLVSLAVGLVGLYSAVPLALAAVAAALAARLALGRGPGSRRPRRPARELLGVALREPLAAAAVVLAGAALLHRALVAVLLPPGGYDALAYHLVFVGDWVRRSRIGGSEFQEAGCCAWYPVNAELTYAWLAVFPHSDRLVGLAQVGYLGFAALATAALARAVGASARAAAVAGALLALTPVALRQANLAYTDVALTAAVLLTAVFMLRLLREDAGGSDVLRFALAAGFTVGIKATAITYVLAACAVVLAGALARRAGRTPSRASLLRAGGVVAVFLVLGSAWYVRSWMGTGNPFWPYRIAVGEQVVFAGPWDPHGVNPTPEPLADLPAALRAPRSWLHDLDVEAQMAADPSRPDARLGGLGLTWLLLGLPALAAALVLALRRRDPRFPALALAVGLPALVAVPDPWWSRFTIPLAAVGMVALAYVLTRLPRAAERAVVVLALALASVGILVTRPLGPLDELRRTAGVPIERPSPRPDGLDYRSLEAMPGDARVGVLPGGPLLRYLALGERFRRTVVALPAHRRPQAVAAAIEDEELEFVVARRPLRERTLARARLTLVERSSGATVYRVERSAVASGAST